MICSFWLVSALAIVHEWQRARDLMERLLRVASPLGLYAEEFDAETGRHLGNFPSYRLALVKPGWSLAERRRSSVNKPAVPVRVTLDWVRQWILR